MVLQRSRKKYKDLVVSHNLRDKVGSWLFLLASYTRERDIKNLTGFSSLVHHLTEIIYSGLQHRHIFVNLTCHHNFVPNPKSQIIGQWPSKRTFSVNKFPVFQFLAIPPCRMLVISTQEEGKTFWGRYLILFKWHLNCQVTGVTSDMSG